MSRADEISIDEAAEKIAAGAQLIDVRTNDEWDGARLGGAIHVPMELLTSKAAEIDKEAPVVFYCFSGVRSAMAAEAFLASGYEAYTMAGGIKAWEQAGRETEPPGAPIVH